MCDSKLTLPNLNVASVLKRKTVAVPMGLRAISLRICVQMAGTYHHIPRPNPKRCQSLPLDPGHVGKISKPHTPHSQPFV